MLETGCDCWAEIRLLADFSICDTLLHDLAGIFQSLLECCLLFYLNDGIKD